MLKMYRTENEMRIRIGQTSQEEKELSGYITEFGDLRGYAAGRFRKESVDCWDAVSLYTKVVPDPCSGGLIDSLGDTHGIHDDAEEIVRDDIATSAALSGGSYMRPRSPYMDLATIAPCPVLSPLLDFNPPAFMEFSSRKSQRALVDHFCNVLSHLIVFKEDTGNPFQQLVLPLSHASSPVLNAIYALSSAHLESRGVENEERSLDFHNKALQGLAQLIERNDANREETLGAIMLLVYYEVLVQRGSSNIVTDHLKGAMTIMKSRSQHESPTSLFLQRAFRFYDVISALSFGTAPISSMPPTLSPFILPPKPEATSLGSVDTLLGMATDLWPIIHRLAKLLDTQREIQAAETNYNPLKTTVLRTEFYSTSDAIELALKNWMPTSPTTSPPPDTSANPDLFEDARMRSILNNAEAYRQSALVYLYRYVKTCPRRSDKVQSHAQLALQACHRVVKWGGPMSALLWPLFISACEAVEAEDREAARAAFDGSSKRQGMMNIVRAWEVVEEVWHNDDVGVDMDWRDVCRERGLSIVFG
ncbi:MAG: hypothetical protein M1818_005604 [Claussenomyces sp. TS43310]|nr:MAG: hypothetical protein M1818_005604 [Claussenomyces sp. TS43310]